MKPTVLIQCWQCGGDGKVPFLYLDTETWDICEVCFGEGTIPDPDQFVNALSDLVTSKEISYDND